MNKPIGTEHWKVENGVFKGLYTISGAKAKEVYGEGKLWEGVEHIISDYIRVHPEEMKEQLVYNKITKDNNFNQFGSDVNNAYRHAMEIPVGLHTVLNEYHPQLFTDRKKLNLFMKKYPGLCACKVT